VKVLHVSTDLVAHVYGGCIGYDLIFFKKILKPFVMLCAIRFDITDNTCCEKK